MGLKGKIFFCILTLSFSLKCLKISQIQAWKWPFLCERFSLLLPMFFRLHGQLQCLWSVFMEFRYNGKIQKWQIKNVLIISFLLRGWVRAVSDVQWGIGCAIGCVCYILASSFCIFKGEDLKNKGNVFYFTLKALFILEIIKF